MRRVESMWKRALLISGAVLFTCARLWQSASSFVISHRPVERVTMWSGTGDPRASSSGALEDRHRHHNLSHDPCSPAQVRPAVLSGVDVDRLVLLSYNLSSSTPGYEALPNGSSAKMLSVQGSCDGGGGGGGAGDDTSEDGATDSYDTTDYDDSGDTSDDA